MDAEEEEPMAEEKDVGKDFGELLLKLVQDLSKWIEEMRQRSMEESRQHETPRGFHVGEGLGMSHHLQEHPTTQHVASHIHPRCTMPTFLPPVPSEKGRWHDHIPLGGYFRKWQSMG